MYLLLKDEENTVSRQEQFNRWTWIFMQMHVLENIINYVEVESELCRKLPQLSNVDKILYKCINLQFSDRYNVIDMIIM